MKVGCCSGGGEGARSVAVAGAGPPEPLLAASECSFNCRSLLKYRSEANSVMWKGSIIGMVEYSNDGGKSSCGNAVGVIAMPCDHRGSAVDGLAAHMRIEGRQHSAGESSDQSWARRDQRSREEVVASCAL